MAHQMGHQQQNIHEGWGEKHYFSKHYNSFNNAMGIEHNCINSKLRVRYVNECTYTSGVQIKNSEFF